MTNIGRTINDLYCNGYFGRYYDLDSAKIEAEGNDWIVVRKGDGTAAFASFLGNDDKQKMVDSWCMGRSDGTRGEQ